MWTEGFGRTGLLAQGDVAQSGAQGWETGCGEEPLRRTQPRDGTGEQVRI